MKTMWRITLFSMFALALGLMVLPQSNRTLAQETSVPAGDLEPTILIKWMQLLYDPVEAEKISAPEPLPVYTLMRALPVINLFCRVCLMGFRCRAK